MHLDRRKAKGHVYETYYCNSYHAGFRRDLLDPFVREKCVELLRSDHYDQEINILIDRLIEPYREGEEQRDYDAEIAKIDRKLARLTSVLLETDLSPETLVLKKQSLEAEKKELLKEKREHEGPLDIEKIRATADKIRDQLLSVLLNENSTADDLRSAISVFVSGIIVDKTETVASVRIMHGVPGYIASVGVADDPRQKVLRPSTYYANRHNLQATITTVFALYNGHDLKHDISA